MADIDLKYSAATSAGTVGAGAMAPYVLNRQVTLAEIEAEKGSAIAASDAVVLWSLPAGSTVISASLEVNTAFDPAGAMTFDYGLGTTDVDRFVDGGDAKSAAVLAQPSIASTNEPELPFPSVLTAADTVEVLVATLASGTATTGTFTAQIVVVPPPSERKGGSARDG